MMLTLYRVFKKVSEVAGGAILGGNLSDAISKIGPMYPLYALFTYIS